jgi:aspartate ammonia-lyase
MTLGQEFSTYGVMLSEDQQRLMEASKLIQEINLGATAIGTGINAPKGYATKVCDHLSRISGLELVTAENLIEATQDAGSFVQLSGVLKRIAVKLSKTCNDLRLLSSGPRAGFGEINLPAVQAGSSIMPGKVNPVIPEVVNQIAFDVIGNDITITMAAEAGQLQLNAFEPIITKNLMNSIIYLRQGCLILADKCIKGITANEDRLAQIFNQSISTVTALNTIIGYEKATFVAKEAFRLNKSVKEILLSQNILPESEIDRLFSVENLIQNN